MEYARQEDQTLRKARRDIVDRGSVSPAIAATLAARGFDVAELERRVIEAQRFRV